MYINIKASHSRVMSILFINSVSYGEVAFINIQCRLLIDVGLIWSMHQPTRSQLQCQGQRINMTWNVYWHALLEVTLFIWSFSILRWLIAQARNMLYWASKYHFISITSEMPNDASHHHAFTIRKHEMLISHYSHSSILIEVKEHYLIIASISIEISWK